MNFRTELNLLPSSKKITLNDSLFCIGSCFAQELYDFFKKSGMGQVYKPLGTIYNPVSIANLLSLPWDWANKKERIIEKGNGLFFHADAPSDCFGTDVKSLQASLQNKELEVRRQLAGATTVVITLGTALVFELEGVSVCNNHKEVLPQRFLKLEEILVSLDIISEQIKAVAPNIQQVIWSISPVRHTRQGIENNARSKALLKVALSEFIENNTGQKVLHSYFAAYELLLDDLRDYRFYADDLVHPRAFAVEYIMQKFQLSFIEDSLVPLMEAAQKYHQALEHRPTGIGLQSEEYKKWQLYLQKTYSSLSQQGLVLEKPHNFINE